MALGATFVPSGVIDVDSAVIGAGWVIGESLASHKEVEAIEDDDCAVINPDAPEQAVHVASVVANQNPIYLAAQNIPNTQEGLSIVETMKRCLYKNLKIVMNISKKVIAVESLHNLLSH